MSNEEILEAIKGMTVLELSELVKALEDQFGVSAAAPVAVAAPAAAPAANGAAAAAEEEQTEFSVVLQEIGPNKINVIKVVRAIAGLGLREAKAVVEAAPKAIMEGISKEEADDILKKLEDTGAKAELK